MNCALKARNLLSRLGSGRKKHIGQGSGRDSDPSSTHEAVLLAPYSDLEAQIDGALRDIELLNGKMQDISRGVAKSLHDPKATSVQQRWRRLIFALSTVIIDADGTLG